MVMDEFCSFCLFFGWVASTTQLETQNDVDDFDKIDLVKPAIGNDDDDHDDDDDDDDNAYDDGNENA